MPPFYEGTLLYMPITLPGASVQTAQQILTMQDKLIKAVPEVESVFGKAGRARVGHRPGAARDDRDGRESQARIGLAAGHDGRIARSGTRQAPCACPAW